MASITLYRDEECKDIFGSGFVGRYRTVFGSSPLINIEYANRVIHDETIEFGQLFNFYASTVVPESDATAFNMPVTETKTLQYLYLSPDNRFGFYCWKTGTNTVNFENGVFEIRINGVFVSVTAIHSSQYQSYMIDNKSFSISFRTCKSGSYNVYGTVIDIRQPNIFAYDLHYFDQQGRPVTNRCFVGVCPFDKYYQEGDTEPYKPDTGSKRRGGTGTGYYPNSVIPALPTNSINAAFSSVLGSGSGLTYYRLEGSALQDITEYLYDTGLSLKFRNSQYRDAVASCIWIPLNVSCEVSNTLNLIYLANKSIPVTSGSANITKQPLREIDFGSVDLTAANIGFKGYADYIHTSAVLYLPCFGAVNIDMAALANGMLHLRGVVDIRNGNILYRVETQGEADDTPVLYGQYNGNCGIPVPIGGANASPTILGAISSIGSVGVGIATGNPLNIIGGVSSLASQTAPDIDTAGAMQPMCAAMGTPVPILQIRKHILSAPPKYEEINGLPADGSTDGVYDDNIYKLSDFTGFLQCAAADVSGLDATDDEKAEIERLLREGVYL